MCIKGELSTLYVQVEAHIRSIWEIHVWSMTQPELIGIYVLLQQKQP